MSAAGLIILILFVIAVGVALYYGVLCYQAHPFDGKGPMEFSDMGHPLLLPSNERDFNGNNESPQAIIPVLGNVSLELPDSATTKDDQEETARHSDRPFHEKLTPSATKHLHSVLECSSASSSLVIAAASNRGNNSFILTLEEEPFLSPAVTKSVASLGRQPTTSTPIHSSHSGKIVVEQSICARDLVTCETPAHYSRQCMSVSYEEDGLLVPQTCAKSELENVSMPEHLSPDIEACTAATILSSNLKSNSNKQVHFSPVLISSSLDSSSHLSSVKTNSTSFSDSRNAATLFEYVQDYQGNKFPCKKMKMSPIEDFCESENLKHVLSTAFSLNNLTEISHQADRDYSELDVSVPVINLGSDTRLGVQKIKPDYNFEKLTQEGNHMMIGQNYEMIHPPHGSISQQSIVINEWKENKDITLEQQELKYYKGINLEQKLKDGEDITLGQELRNGDKDFHLGQEIKDNKDITLEQQELKDKDMTISDQKLKDKDTNVVQFDVMRLGYDHPKIDNDDQFGNAAFSHPVDSPELYEKYSKLDDIAFYPTMINKSVEVITDSEEKKELAQYSWCETQPHRSPISGTHFSTVSPQVESIATKLSNDESLVICNPIAMAGPNDIQISDSSITIETASALIHCRTHSNSSDSSTLSSSSIASNGSYCLENTKKQLLSTHSPLKMK